MKRAFAAAFATLLPLTIVSLPATAAVKDPRTIEVFYERDLVLVKGFPTDSPLRVEVWRGGTLLGFHEGQPVNDPDEGPGFLEINHGGGADCWQSANTPNIQPGDEVRTTVVNTPADVDSTFVRNVSIDFAATAFDSAAGTITINGVVRSTASAPIVVGTDVIELRLNKVNDANTWDTGDRPGRRDLREDVAAADIRTDGTFTHVFDGLTAEDVVDAQTNGVDQILEWSLPSASQELTVYDASEGVPPGCPALGPGDPIPTDGVRSTPQPLTFARQTVGTTSAAATATLTNTGTTPATLTSFTVNGVNPADFTILNSSSCDDRNATTNELPTLAPGGTCTWDVTFTPAAAGARSASINTTTDGTGGGGQVLTELRGTGTTPAAPAVTLRPASMQFAQRAVGTVSPNQSVTLTNSGTAPLNLAGVSLTGANAAQFGMSNNDCVGTIAAAGTCTVDVRYAPSAAGTHSASLTFTSNAAGSPHRVALSGTATATTTAATLRINNRSRLEGDSGTRNLVFTITRAGNTSDTSAVSVRTANGNFASANATVANRDYFAVPLTRVTFAAGETTKTVTVRIRGDLRPEPNEKFRVLLSNPSGATVTDSLGIGTINNDD